MKLYRHYKNKPYRYIGVAKHSETLDEMVVYECRYPNDLSRLWVRPRKMFEESVNGLPRFAKIEARLEFVTQILEAHFDQLKPLNEALFSDWDETHFRAGFENKRDVMLITGSVDRAVVGYKLGYRSVKDPEAFYSWMGGVHPDFRGVGLAEDLMRAQHRWAKDQGYKKVTTKTMNRFKPMLALNIKAGFDVVAAELDSKDNRFKIHLEKTL